jgi:hypothetical protein
MLIEERGAGCIPVFPETYQVVMLEKGSEIVKVRILSYNKVANQFEGWTETENIKPAG